MIRKLLATTAIATLVATGAYAQTTAPAPMETQQVAPNVIHAEGHLASNIIGETVYNGSHDDAENIGSINDLVLANDGTVEAVIVGVGGFLGLGQKNVALDYDLVQWVDRDGDRWIVIETTREALEALEEFDTAAFRPLPADAQVGNTRPATAEDLGVATAPAAAPATDVQDDGVMAEAPAGEAAPLEDDTALAPADEAVEDDMAAAPADEAAPLQNDTAAAPADEVVEDDVAAAPANDQALGTDQTQTSAIDRSSLSDVDTAVISADEFIGTTVYGANDENIGSISDLLVSDNGVDAVIVDVGGFLGIGAKSVAIGMENLAFLSDENGNYYLYTQFTREQLEAQPEYDEASFAERRDDQLMVAPVR